ncbi:phospho-sugar mutase [Mariniluteicoccus flavus]
MLAPEVAEAARRWMDTDIDAVTAAALEDLLVKAGSGDAAAVAEVTAAFAGPLEFGTAGLRGPLGPGPARMNRVVVCRTAAGLGTFLRRQGLVGKVLIGFDARYNSDVFARDTAEILQALGFEALLTEGHVPTPVVAYGIKQLGCVAGVVVTASHNPPQDNGYKVYLGDGSQIIPPNDQLITGCIREFDDVHVADLPRSDAYARVGDDLLESYVARVAGLAEGGPTDVEWVYTAMHGVGAAIVERVTERAGFPAPREVAEQRDPDPAFPTVAFPNPEEPGAIDLSLDLARAQGADLVVANDPDADRCAVAIWDPTLPERALRLGRERPRSAQAPRVEGDWRMLHGDELGALLGDDFTRRGVAGAYANSVVSGSMLARIADAAGQPHVTTLTGFKWIGRVPGLAFGYEEAIGYCCDPAAVADKDGISTLVTVLALAARLKAEGLTIADRLDELARTHGVHRNGQWAVRVTDLSIIADAMARLRAQPPATLAGEPVEVVDLAAGSDTLPPTDGVQLRAASATVTVRPSGTEPKLKCYLEARESPEASRADLAAARGRADARLDALKREIADALGLA